MENYKQSYRPPSSSSANSSRQNPANRSKSPVLSDYEYVGRLVTHERAIRQKPNSIEQSHIFPQNKHKFHQSNASQYNDIQEEVSAISTDDDSDGLSKPLGVIRISDRHVREIYRLPTPPPKIKRVYHRLKSPEPKVIERVFVRRPQPQVIENIIEIPPEKVRIINREKYLKDSEPITRSKIVKLKSNHHRHRHRAEEEEKEEEVDADQYTQGQQQQQQQQQQPYAFSQQYAQQPQSTMQSNPYQQETETSLVYPPQTNMNTVGYFESTVPPNMMFQSQNPLELSSQQITYNAPGQSNFYQYASQQPSIPEATQSETSYYKSPQLPVHSMAQSTRPLYTSLQMPVHQIIPPSTHHYGLQQPSTQQITAPTPYYIQPQQTANNQMPQPTPYYIQPQQTINNQMPQPTPYYYPSSQ